MKILEICAAARSGHHAMVNWVVKNISGYEYEMGNKLKVLPNGVYYINEGNHDKNLTLDYIESFSKNNGRTLLISYENTHPNYTVLNENERYIGPMSINNQNIYNFDENYRIVFIRNFYNNIASRIQDNNNSILNNQPIKWNVTESFFTMWKEQAKYAIEGKCLFLKYEDWVTSKEKRNEFMKSLTKHGELFNNKVSGTHSSFNDTNIMNRWKSVEFPKEVKDLIRNDNELHYLMGAIGYDYIKF